MALQLRNRSLQIVSLLAMGLAMQILFLDKCPSYFLYVFAEICTTGRNVSKIRNMCKFGVERSNTCLLGDTFTFCTKNGLQKCLVLWDHGFHCGTLKLLEGH